MKTALTAAAAAAALAAPAAAQNPFSEGDDAVRAAVEAGEIMSFVQILDKLSARRAAFVTEVELDREDVDDRETWVYEIEALNEDLEEIEIEAGARDGAILDADD